MWAQKSTLWQNLPGRMTFWCSSQPTGRAVGQGAFPLLPRYPWSEKAVSHFWPFLLFVINFCVVILPNSKLFCVLVHGRSCSAWKDLTPLIHHFHSSPSANPVADTIKLQYNVKLLISTFTFNNCFMKQLLSLTIWMHEKKFPPLISQSSSVRWLSSEWTPFEPSAVVVTSRAWKISFKHERIISVICWNKCLGEVCWWKVWKKKFYFDWSSITDTSQCISYTNQAKTSFPSKVSVSSTV